MDTKIFALLVFVGVLGSFMEAQAAYFGYPYPYGNGQLRGPTSVNFVEMPRSKREIGDSNGETTTSQATTTTPSSTNPTTTPSSSSTTPSSTTPSSTTPSSTTPSTSPTTTPTTATTEATSPTTTPTSTSATTPTTTSATTPSTTTPSTTPESTKSTSKPKKSTDNDVQSRSNFDESEDSSKKPGSSSKDDKTSTPGPNYGPGVPGAGFGGFGPGFDPYSGYPGFNSIPGPGPNYAWTGTNNAPGYASAGASAGSFAGYPGYPGAGGYPGMGYPGAGYPGAGYPGAGYPGAGYPGPGYPMRGQQPTTTESPSLNNRGGFQDNSPSQNTPNYGGVDPYNAGPGFLFPGQFPNFNDPTFDMIRQIQAQIEAQHQAIGKSITPHHANRGEAFAYSTPYAYSNAQPNMNNMRRRPTFDGLGVGNSNMDLHNRLANDAANYGGGSYGGGVPQVASASIGLGPGGGFQAGQISPAAPGIESRFAEDLPAPSGNSFGVFASSSSSSMTGPDGKPIGHKSSVTGVNDNGKISYHSVHD